MMTINVYGDKYYWYNDMGECWACKPKGAPYGDRYQVANHNVHDEETVMLAILKWRARERALRTSTNK